MISKKTFLESVEKINNKRKSIDEISEVLQKYGVIDGYLMEYDFEITIANILKEAMNDVKDLINTYLFEGSAGVKDNLDLDVSSWEDVYDILFRGRK